MKLSVTDTISNFLASGINTFLLNMILYGLLFYVITPTLSTHQIAFVVVLLVILSVLAHIKGLTQGMVIATVHREQMEKEIARFMNEMQDNKEDKDD